MAAKHSAAKEDVTGFPTIQQRRGVTFEVFPFPHWKSQLGTQVGWETCQAKESQAEAARLEERRKGSGTLVHAMEDHDSWGYR